MPSRSASSATVANSPDSSVRFHWPAVSSFTKVPFGSTTLGAEQPQLNSEFLGRNRDPLAPIMDAVTDDRDVVVPISLTTAFQPKRVRSDVCVFRGPRGFSVSLGSESIERLRLKCILATPANQAGFTNPLGRGLFSDHATGECPARHPNAFAG